MTQSYFNSKADIWDEKIAEKDSDKLENMAKNLDIQPGSIVLDVGTGTGIFVPFLLKKVGNKGNLVCLDSAEMMLEKARKKNFKGNIAYVCSDIAKFLQTCSSISPWPRRISASLSFWMICSGVYFFRGIAPPSGCKNRPRTIISDGPLLWEWISRSYAIRLGRRSSGARSLRRQHNTGMWRNHARRAARMSSTTRFVGTQGPMRRTTPATAMSHASVRAGAGSTFSAGVSSTKATDASAAAAF